MVLRKSSSALVSSAVAAARTLDQPQWPTQLRSSYLITQRRTIYNDYITMSVSRRFITSGFQSRILENSLPLHFRESCNLEHSSRIYLQFVLVKESFK